MYQSAREYHPRHRYTVGRMSTPVATYSSGYDYGYPMGTMSLPPEDLPVEDEIVPGEGEESVDIVENGSDVIDLDATDEPEEITTESWWFSSTVAQQIFSIVPGIAGGLAGFILALKLANTKNVKASEILLSSLIVAGATFGSVFLIKTVE